MASAGTTESLIAAARDGDKRAIGRLISTVENDHVAAVNILRAVYADSHDAWLTGLTGAPGAGKSTLANLLIGEWRERGKRVAVLAVDPTSPFTGGALLGDRIRMQHGSQDGGVLVRSMATRGWLGGMSRATERVATLCAGIGFDEVLIETVGVGQSEVDVAAAADTTVVVVTPGWGDGVQVAKAGVMEIGDVFVVNKADRDGTDIAVRELLEMLQLVVDQDWYPPVVPTVATSGAGLEDLTAALTAHRAALAGPGDDHRRATRRIRDFRRAVLNGLEAALSPLVDGPAGTELMAEVGSGARDPWSAAAALIERARIVPGGGE
jgi:LAO/AO transport system kinase